MNREEERNIANCLELFDEPPHARIFLDEFKTNADESLRFIAIHRERRMGKERRDGMYRRSIKETTKN